MKFDLNLTIRANWSAPQKVVAFTTTTALGDFCCSHQTGLQNYLQLAKQLGMQAHWLNQIHSDRVLYIDDHLDRSEQSGDALYTTNCNQLLGVQTADCVPIFLSNQAATWIAVIHAGWRGIWHNIIAKTIACYQQTSSLIACIGPTICQSHYQVDEVLYQRFYQQPALIDIMTCFRPDSQPKKYRFDLSQAAYQQLQASDVQSITQQSACTYNEERLFSYRQNRESSRQMNIIGLLQS